MTRTDDTTAVPTRAAGVPRVVIVGRPNVGKSTLFNALAGRRVAIEDPVAGVTRDRVSFVLDVDNRSVELIDTGGMGHVDNALLKEEVDEQIATALELADHVLFVVDAKAGLDATDREVAARLRRVRRPVILVANKVESVKDEVGVAEAYTLGFGDPIRVSAKERLGTGDLRDLIVEVAGEDAVTPMMPSDVVRLAIVGRMNVGKSTLVNALVGEDRVIVSDVPGTTRDAVDAPFQVGGLRFVAIDTAGIRKRRTITDSVEFYGQARAERAIRRADVAWLLIDATRDVGRIDRQIGGLITDACLPCVIVVTKWDLAREKANPGDYEEYLRSHLSGLAHAPLALICAPEGLNLEPTLKLTAELHAQAGRRVGTGELNRVLRRAYERRKPRPWRGRIGKVYYASQVDAHPPTIVVFVNDPEHFEEAWRRYLAHALQEELGFPDVPVKIVLQPRGGGAAGERS